VAKLPDWADMSEIAWPGYCWRASAVYWLKVSCGEIGRGEKWGGATPLAKFVERLIRLSDRVLFRPVDGVLFSFSVE
jgi:hypothetical protein